MRDKILHLKNLKKSFSGRTVVDIKELVMGTHGIEGLIGPNGAGKTTLINLISSNVSPDSGEIMYFKEGAGYNILKKSSDAIARLGLVKTNQIIQDFDRLSIMDSMLLSLTNPKYEKFYSLFSEKKVRQEAEHEIEWYLNYFSFKEPDGKALSAGEKKLLDIIRCMLLKPSCLLMDEPTAGLPHDQKEKVIELMYKKSSEEGMSIIIVEHDLDLIWRVSEHIFFMAEGEIMLEGSVDEIRSHELVINKYMGEDHAKNQ